MTWVTVEDLIEELKKYDKNMEVRVAYRDSGGFYYGSDHNLVLEVEDGKLIL